MKPIILHISNDYPDPLRPDKTRAIQNLIEATPEFRHVVYSLNRVNGLGGITSIPFGDDKVAIAYGALPKGLFWERRLSTVAQWIYQDLQEKGIRPTLIQAHKITVEGIIGHILSKRFGCKLICDIQGGTDYRILKIKRNLHGRFKEIAAHASLIFPYAPWVIEPFQKTINLDKAKCTLLPVLPGFDKLIPSKNRRKNKLVTLIRFGDRKNKNIAGTLAAIQQLKSQYPTLTLDIFGGGNPTDLMKMQALIKRYELTQHVQFKGPIANNALQAVLHKYTALIMPSFTETYGLIYAEALFSGVPVLFSKGRAIDGYFDTSSIGYACDPTSVSDIAHGISYLLNHEDRLKNNIATMQQKGVLEGIRREPIIATYRNALLEHSGITLESLCQNEPSYPVLVKQS